MTIISAYPSTTVLSTAWMPLDGLIQQWGAFGAEQASTATALHAVGMAFCALARETTARAYYTAADCPIYGHDWQTVGMSGEKKCLACGTLGYCPGCAPDPPPHAHPFSCSRHTPLTESQVRP